MLFVCGFTRSISSFSFSFNTFHFSFFFTFLSDSPTISFTLYFPSLNISLAVSHLHISLSFVFQYLPIIFSLSSINQFPASFPMSFPLYQSFSFFVLLFLSEPPYIHTYLSPVSPVYRFDNMDFKSAFDSNYNI